MDGLKSAAASCAVPVSRFERVNELKSLLRATPNTLAAVPLPDKHSDFCGDGPARCPDGLFESLEAVDVALHVCEGFLLHQHNMLDGENYLLIADVVRRFDNHNSIPEHPQKLIIGGRIAQFALIVANCPDRLHELSIVRIIQHIPR